MADGGQAKPDPSLHGPKKALGSVQTTILMPYSFWKAEFK